jgi:hypothetical protein
MKKTSVSWVAFLNENNHKLKLHNIDGFDSMDYFLYEEISYDEFMDKLSNTTIECDIKIFDLKF